MNIVKFCIKAPLYRKVIIVLSIFTIFLCFNQLFRYIALERALKDVKMVFVNCIKFSNKAIYTQNIDGTELLCITGDESGRHDYPLFSPDGNKICYLFRNKSAPVFQLFIIDSNGRNKVQLTDLPEKVWSMTWSIDGEKIYYSSAEQEKFDIFSVDINTIQKEQVTFQDSNNIRPDLSFDNRYLVYESYIHEGDDGYIFMTDLETGTYTQLTDTEDVDMDPKFSPDGNKIIFVRLDEEGTRGIFLMNSDGTEIQNLTENQGNNWFASWSPDGKKIAFQSDRDSNIEIYIMNLDGSNLTRLTNDPMVDWYPVWHPGGKWVIFNSDRGSDPYGTSIYMVDVKGKKIIDLINLQGRESYPDIVNSYSSISK